MPRFAHSSTSPSMIVACLALAVALGGTGYAAVTLPKNSVGTAQLKKNAVTTAKVRDATLRLADFAVAERASLKGDAGTAGSIGDKGEQGPAGPTGPAGAPGPPGLSEYQVVTASTSVSTANALVLTVTCPAGKRALGGGVNNSLWNSQYGPVVVASVPAGNGTQWFVRVATVNNTLASWTSLGYAVCARVP